MVEISKLTLMVRDKVGTNAARRLRKEGRVPANVYGQGKPTTSLSVDRRELNDTLGSNAQFMELDVGGEKETALIRDLQYDTYGLQVLHIEFERANIDVPLVISVPLVLRGRAKGVGEGGIMERIMDHVQMKVAPRYMPETIEVNVTAMDVGDSILIGSITIPESAELVDEPEKPICTIHAPQAEEEEEVVDAEETEGDDEPEVLGGKKPDAEPAE